MTAVSIFTGAGGLDIGIERAGGDVLSTLEIHPSYCATVRNMKARGVVNPCTGRAYFQGAKIIQGDILDISSDIERSIRYTKYDNLKNGAFRVRARRTA